MISLLRKIRKSLLESGSTQKYLLYAFGEIAWVVIGMNTLARPQSLKAPNLKSRIDADHRDYTLEDISRSILK